ncbi:sigma-70 family RNA polymerase sigma factor [Cerasicoccus frondis]|uniref:sigma-70 family RNA polymerase sigma factor n=1 Tax=Cerasicoccus frondis TaxID=490090 RepID=UPI0028525F7F|nr:sigma-70 family RNA polymerase sigma factor [Cerasicoccus frondis]
MRNTFWSARMDDAGRQRAMGLAPGERSVVNRGVRDAAPNAQKLAKTQFEIWANTVGAKTYTTADGVMRQSVDETGRPLFTEKDMGVMRDGDGKPFLAHRNQYGETEFERPKIVAADDPNDPHFYYDLPDGTRERAFHGDDALNHENPKVRVAAEKARASREKQVEGSALEVVDRQIAEVDREVSGMELESAEIAKKRNRAERELQLFGNLPDSPKKAARVPQVQAELESLNARDQEIIQRTMEGGDLHARQQQLRAARNVVKAEIELAAYDEIQGRIETNSNLPKALKAEMLANIAEQRQKLGIGMTEAVAEQERLNALVEQGRNTATSRLKADSTDAEFDREADTIASAVAIYEDESTRLDGLLNELEGGVLTPEAHNAKVAEARELRDSLLRLRGYIESKGANYSDAAKAAGEKHLSDMVAQLEADIEADPGFLGSYGTGAIEQAGSRIESGKERVAQSFQSEDSIWKFGLTNLGHGSESIGAVFDMFKGMTAEDIEKRSNAARARMLIGDLRGEQAKTAMRKTIEYAQKLEEGGNLVDPVKLDWSKPQDARELPVLQALVNQLRDADTNNADRGNVASNEFQKTLFSTLNLVNLVPGVDYSYEQSQIDRTNPEELAKFNALQQEYARIIEEKYPNTALAGMVAGSLGQFMMTRRMGNVAVGNLAKVSKIGEVLNQGKRLERISAGLGYAQMGVAQSYSENPNQMSFLDRFADVGLKAATLAAAEGLGNKAEAKFGKLAGAQATTSNLLLRQGTNTLGAFIGENISEFSEAWIKGENPMDQLDQILKGNAGAVLGMGLLHTRGAIRTQKEYQNLSRQHGQATAEMANRIADINTLASTAQGSDARAIQAQRALSMIQPGEIEAFNQFAATVLEGSPELKGHSLEERAVNLQDRHERVLYVGQVAESLQHRMALGQNVSEEIAEIESYQPADVTGVQDSTHVDAYRDGARALIRAANGVTGDQMTEGEQVGLGIVGQELGTSAIRMVGGKAVITDKARDWLLERVPSAQALLPRSEQAQLERIQEASSVTTESAEQPKAKTKAKAGLTVSFTGDDGQADETQIPSGATLANGDPVTARNAAQWLAEEGIEARDVEIQTSVPKTPKHAPVKIEGNRVKASDLLREIVNNARVDGIEIDGGRAVAVARNVARDVNAAIDKYAPLFSGISIQQGAKGTGGVQTDLGQRLLVNVTDLVSPDNAQNLIDPERLELLIQEEAIHAVATLIVPKLEAAQIWIKLPDATQEVVRKVYEEGGSPAQDWQLGHEFLRMVVQGRINLAQGKDKVTSEERLSPSLLQRIGKALARLRDYFRDLRGSLSADGAAPEVVDLVESTVTQIEEKLLEIEKPGDVSNLERKVVDGQSDGIQRGRSTVAESTSTKAEDNAPSSGRDPARNGNGLSDPQTVRSPDRGTERSDSSKELEQRPAGPKKAKPKRNVNRKNVRPAFPFTTDADSFDVIDLLQSEGGLLGKTHAIKAQKQAGKSAKLPPEYDGYDEAFGSRNLHKDLLPLYRYDSLVTSTGQAPDQLTALAVERNLLNEGAGTSEFFELVASTAKRRATGQTEDAKDRDQDFIESVTEDRPGGETVSPEQLAIGDRFEVEGEEFEVTDIDPDTGEVEVKDGPRFGVQDLPPEMPLVIDAGSLETDTDDAPVEFLTDEDFELAGQTEEELVSDREREAESTRKEQQRQELEERQAKRLVGDAGDAAQGSLFDEPGETGELFAPPTPKQVSENLKGISREANQALDNAFEGLFSRASDQQMRDFLLGKPIIELTGEEFQRDGSGISIFNKVAAFFEGMDGKSTHPQLGDVILNRNSVKSSWAHGAGSLKAAAFAAVPDVIQNGRIIHQSKNWRGRGEARVVLAAPVKIGSEDVILVVVTRRQQGQTRFYLHEAYTKERIRGAFKTGSSASGEVEISSASSDSVSNILSRILFVNQDKDDVLGARTADMTQKGLPPEKIGAFVQAAQALIGSGVNTPEAMAQVLETKFQGKAAAYSQALWDAFGMVNPELRGTHDWNKAQTKSSDKNELQRIVVEKKPTLKSRKSDSKNEKGTQPRSSEAKAVDLQDDGRTAYRIAQGSPSPDAQIQALRDAGYEAQEPDKESYLDEGSEVSVYLDGNRVYKVTHAGDWGIYPKAERAADGSVFFDIGGESTPARFLERIALQNHYFDDNKTVFEGVLADGRMVASQPYIVGRPATFYEIGQTLQRAGFTPLPGHPIDWAHPTDHVILMDAHEGNFISTPQGVVVPIDVAIHQLRGRQVSALKTLLDENETLGARTDGSHQIDFFKALDGRTKAKLPKTPSGKLNRLQLVQDNLGLATDIAVRYFTVNNSAQHDDIVQEARRALMKAGQKFDDTAGTPFAGYAGRVIRNRLNDLYRKQSTQNKREGSSLDTPINEAGDTLGSLIEGDGPTPYDREQRAERKRLLGSALASLNDDERKLAFAFMAGSSLAEIGRREGLSREGMRKRMNKILGKLKNQMTEQGVARNDVLSARGDLRRALKSPALQKTPSEYTFEPTEAPNEQIQAAINPQKIRPVDSAHLRARHLPDEETTGASIQFYQREGSDTEEGFVIPSMPTVIFVNAKSDRAPLAWTLAHEFAHIAEKDPNSGYAELEQTLLNLIIPEERAIIVGMFAKHYGETSHEKEITPYLIGDVISGFDVMGVDLLKKAEQIKSAINDYIESAGPFNPQTLAEGSDDDLSTLLSRRDDAAAINDFLQALNLQIPSQSDIDEMYRQAGLEAPGAQSIGRPDLANPAEEETARRLVDAVDEARKMEAERQTHADWAEQARERIAQDRDGVKRNLLEMAATGQGISDPIDVKAAQILVNDLIKQATASGDALQMREAQQLTWAYRESGSEQARAFAARRDPFKKPADRYREFLASVIFHPNATTKERVSKALSPLEKSRLIDDLKGQIKRAKARGENKTLKRLNKELAETEATKDKMQLMADENSGRLKRIEQALANMGVTLNHVFNGEAYLRLRGSKMIGNVVKTLNYDQVKRQVVKLNQKRLKSEEIATRLNIPLDEVKRIKQDMERAMREKLAKLGDAALDLESFDDEALMARGDEGLSKAQRKAKIDAIIAAMGLDDADTDTLAQTRRKQLKRSRVKTGRGRNKRTATSLQRSFEDYDWEIDKPRAKDRHHAKPAQRDLTDPDGPPMFDVSDPVQVAQVARTLQSIDGGGFDMAFEFWVNSVLSGPLTQGRNILGNALNAAWDLGFERLGEAMLNATLAKFGMGSENAPQLGEFRHMARGMLPGMARGIRNALNSWAAETPLFANDVLNQQLEILPEYFDKQGSIRASIPGKTGKTIRIPGRLLLFADEFSKSLIAQVEAGAVAYRIAKGEGLEGEALERRITGLINMPGSVAWHQAAEKAIELTYQDTHEERKQGSFFSVFEVFGRSFNLISAKKKGANWGDVLTGINWGRSKVPGARYIVPFVTSPFNILLQGIGKSPIGTMGVIAKLSMASMVKWKDGVPIGQTYPKPKLVRDFTQQVMAWAGTALLWGISEGDDDDEDKFILVTGGHSRTSQGANELKQRTGMTSYTIRIGNNSFKYGGIEPFATTIGTTVDLIRSVKAGVRSEDSAGIIASRLPIAMLQSIASQSTEKTFLKGIGDIVESMQDVNINEKGEIDTGYKLENFAINFLASWVPNIIKQPLREIDSKYRETDADSLGESVLLRMFPMLAPPSVNVYGEEEIKQGSSILRPIFPVTIGEAPKIRKVDAMLLRYNRNLPDGAKAWAPAPTQRYVTINGERIDLNPKQLQAYRERSGQLFTNLLKGMSFNYENPTEGDIEKVQRALRLARETTKRQMRSSLLAEK